MGRHNLINTDLAIINCLLSFGAIVSISLSILKFKPDGLFTVLAIVLYVLQFLESLVISSTIRTLWKQSKWIPLKVFKVWFY